MLEKPTFNPGRGRLPGLGAVCCLVALSAVRDGVLLMRHDVPAGIDGFYYAVQVRSLIENGAFYYPTQTPLVLYIMGAAARLGGNVFGAVKGTSILSHVILSLSLFALAASFTRSTWTGLWPPPSPSAPAGAGRETNIMWLVSGAPCRAGQNALVVSRGRRCTLLVRETYALPVTDEEKSQIMAANPHLESAPQELIGRVLTREN